MRNADPARSRCALAVRTCGGALQVDSKTERQWREKDLADLRTLGLSEESRVVKH